MVLIYLLLPSLLSSLVAIGDELGHLRRKGGALVFDLVSCAETLGLAFLLQPPLFLVSCCCQGALARRSGRSKVSYLIL